jgi:hypothetical protein
MSGLSEICGDGLINILARSRDGWVPGSQDRPEGGAADQAPRRRHFLPSGARENRQANRSPVVARNHP